MKRIILLLFAVFLNTASFAQQLVITQPQGSVSLNSSSTIAVTNTFQSIWAADTTSRGRVSCTVVNYGVNTMYVFFGAIADATKAKSIQLATGQATYCNNGSIVLKDQVSITGTSGDAFVATLQ